jgi:hypothetical protein
MSSTFYPVKGLSELVTSLRALPDGLGEQALMKALIEAGQPIVTEIIGAAPRKAPAPDMADAWCIKKTGPTSIAITTDSKKPHAFLNLFHEFGTRRMGKRPFARPVWDSRWEAMVDLFRDRLAPLVQAAARRVARRAPK